jgi:hypothetical protein
MSSPESGPRHAAQPFAPPPGYGERIAAQQRAALPPPQTMAPQYAQYQAQPMIAPKSPVSRQAMTDS